MRCMLSFWGVAMVLSAHAQVFTETIQFQWEAQPRVLSINENTQLYYPHFQGAVYDEAHPQCPLWVKRLPLAEYSRLSVEVLQAEYQPVAASVVFKAGEIGENLSFETPIVLERRQPVGLVRFTPIRRNPTTLQYEQLVSAQLRITATPATPEYPIDRGSRNTTVSALADGTVYKIATNETGIYKITYSFLQDLGIDVDNINPRNIQLYGNGGEVLPEYIDANNRVDDLMENAIYVHGEADGSFDSGDYILFYAKGTRYWRFDAVKGKYFHFTNPYTNDSHYFIKLASTQGKRIAAQPSASGASYTTNAYDALAHHETDQINLMEENYSLPASGRRWFGEPFQITRNRSFDFDFQNRIESEPLKVRSIFIGRVPGSTGTLTYGINGTTAYTDAVPTTTYSVYDPYAQEVVSDELFTANGNDVNINVQFSHASSSAEGWLDMLSINARCQLSFTGGQMPFRDHQTMGNSVAAYQLGNATNATIWDVTDPYNTAVQQTTLSGGTASFAADASVIREFIAFDGSSFLTPTAKGQINNQNLHGITTPPDMVIVYHSSFAQAALQLANHRRQFNNFEVLAVDLETIYNEFSSGNADVTAIRDMARMFYDRGTGTDELRYLLLMGDGSFDYKGLNTNRPSNSNYVPVYETSQSLDPLKSYTSDDYFGILDLGEGNTDADQAVDMAVGRLPVKSASEASNVVQKIIEYETLPDRLADWRNRLLFVCDDGDNNLHISDAEGIAGLVRTSLAPLYNQEKIYIDAYQQQSTAGGNRYPDVNEAILNTIFKGALVIDYLGHGGEDGWAQERIFTLTEINQLDNTDRLPLFITATCSFAPYDDPNIVSAGELLLLDPDGGACALMTTTRVVYADANEQLTRNTFESLFTPVDANGTMPLMGEVIRTAKNATGILSKANSRKFTLLGDPAMRLAYPQHRVLTTKINGLAVSATDTLRALQPVTIEGEVQDIHGNLLSNFNGTVYPTVFDKVDTVLTRANDPGSQVRAFPLQKKVIFKGSASVVNGKFTFSFIMPQDINYQMGKGRISYYAENQSVDAHGIYTDVTIGGTFANVAPDNKPPLVQVFMNDDKFASGGITDDSPLLYAKLYDEHGINTVGNSIGHDLTGRLTLLSGEEEEYMLNDFYVSEKDNYQRGTISYPLKDLPEGRHTARVKAWDVYNNVGEGSTEFIVASDAKLALEHVLNYPNPFTTHTSFQFEHNFPYQSLDVQVQIFTVAGQVVKTINQTIVSEGYRVDDIEWDGLDEYGDRIGRGVYVYKITVRANDARGETQQESDYQKLVILR